MDPALDDSRDDFADRYAGELERALLARALAGTGSLPGERARALLADWLSGTYNAAAAGVPGLHDGHGMLAWEPVGDTFNLLWFTPGGIVCPLARLYPQENDTWAAMVVAGVKDTPEEAMAAAEWAIARLTSN